MSDFAPHDLMSALPWRRAVFTTYALSLSFFEAVILDALTRGRAQDAIIFADISGVRAALGEQGARRAGRDYQIEPFAVETGVFHPKITALSADNDCHLLVGSGNLTFGGWGGNLEAVEHLHPSFAADAFDDTAEFFELLASKPGIRHDAGQTCEAIANDLRGAAVGGRRNGDIRLLHNLDGAVGDKLVEFVEDLGGATRLVAASPYWNGTALDRLCGQLRLDEAYIHSHPAGTVRGRLGGNWPTGAKSSVRPVLVDLLRDQTPRPLHAKMFEIVCKHGRIVLSGSANATSAALSSGSNVEACVIRIDREPSTGWTVDPTSAPEPMEVSDDGDDEEDLTGVLRAALSDDRIRGRILHPLMTGPARIFQVTSEGPVLLGAVELGAQSTFEIPAPNLELLSWSGGRLIVRVEGGGRSAAEGFVSIVSYGEIRRRIGNMAPRLFALLSGTETPEDVAAIMSWFYEDPKRLSTPKLLAGGSSEASSENASATVSVADLISGRTGPAERAHEEPIAAIAWKRFVDSVMAAFRSPRKPFSSTSSENSESDDEDNANDDTVIDPAIYKSLATFERLFDLLLAPEHAGQHSLVALDLAQYISLRLQPDPALVKSWLDRALRELVGREIPPDRMADVTAAALVMYGINLAEIADDRLARLRLLRLGADLNGPPPSLAGVQGFVDILGPAVDYQAGWQRLQNVRSLPEQARAYLDALKAGKPSDGYPDLPAVAEKAWPTMEQAIVDPDFRGDIIELDQPMRACPRHHRVLPLSDFVDLQEIRIAIARDCCERILVCRGL